MGIGGARGPVDLGLARIGTEWRLPQQAGLSCHESPACRRKKIRKIRLKSFQMNGLYLYDYHGRNIFCLIDKNMKKKELCEKAGISSSTIVKMGRQEPVSVELIGKICLALGCTANDVLEFLPDEDSVKA